MKNVNKIIKDVVFGLAVTAVGLWVPHTADACTGITLKSQDGATVLARTIEWGGSYLNSRYVVVPRGICNNRMCRADKKTDWNLRRHTVM